MRQVTQTRLALPGLMAAIAVTLADAAMFLVSSGMSMKRLAEWPLFQHGLELILRSAILGFLSWFFAFLLSCWLVHLTSRRQGGQGPLGGLISGLGFAHIPWAGLIPLFALADMNSFSLPAALVLFLLFWAWSVWLAVRAIEANYDFPDYFPSVRALTLPLFPVLVLAGPGLLVIGVGVAIFSVVGFG